MTEEAVRSQLSETLKRAKALVGQLVKDRTSREDYSGARSGLEWAELLNSISSRLDFHDNGSQLAPTATASETAVALSPPQLPYYRREFDNLVKIGKKRGGAGIYKHPVPKDNFDQIISALEGFAESARRFDTKSLQDEVAQIPRHQPLVVLAVLEEQRLVHKTQRGHWAFTHRTGFSVASKTVWGKISQG